MKKIGTMIIKFVDWEHFDSIMCGIIFVAIIVGWLLDSLYMLFIVILAECSTVYHGHRFLKKRGFIK